jgi:hypothetical protein
MNSRADKGMAAEKEIREFTGGSFLGAIFFGRQEF